MMPVTSKGEKIEKVWNEVWRPILCAEVGLETESLNFDLVKRELYEYHILREYVKEKDRFDIDALENDVRAWYNDTPMDDDPWRKMREV